MCRRGTGGGGGGVCVRCMYVDVQWYAGHRHHPQHHFPAQNLIRRLRIPRATPPIAVVVDPENSFLYLMQPVCSYVCRFSGVRVWVVCVCMCVYACVCMCARVCAASWPVCESACEIFNAAHIVVAFYIHTIL